MGSAAQDQATALRKIVSGSEMRPPSRKISGMRSVAVLSGKGGVGKSNLAVNVGAALAEHGVRTAILDADLGLASIDVLFGVMPKFNLGHVLRGEKELAEIVMHVGKDLVLIPGGAGLQELADLDEQRQQWIVGRLGSLEEDIDILILDASAGIHKNVLSFAMSCDAAILITTPEPTSIRDAYGVLKALCKSTGGTAEIKLVVNMAADEKEGLLVAERIISAAEQFLGYRVTYLGCVLWDQKLRDAVRERRPLLTFDPASAAARGFRMIASRLAESDEMSAAAEPQGESFLSRLTGLMRRRRSRQG